MQDHPRTDGIQAAATGAQLAAVDTCNLGVGNVIDEDVGAEARGLMPELRRELEALVRIPSVSVPGRIDPPLLDAFEMTSCLFAEAGVAVGRLDLPDTAPVVTGEIPAPPGAPTVLLHSHYDVVPAGDESLWTSPPFEPTERDGTLVARGVADTKSNILAHVCGCCSA